MARIRISTTVDAARLDACRRLLRRTPDSRLVDRALEALIHELEAEAELRALAAHPYEHDPDLAWQVSEGPPLPYDGDVPAEVLERARRRRTKR